MFFLWPVKFFRIVVETTTSCSSGIFPLKLLCRHTLSIWRQSRLVIFFLVRYSRISVNIIIIAALTFKTFDCFKQGTLVYTKDSQILINILCRLLHIAWNVLSRLSRGRPTIMDYLPAEVAQLTVASDSGTLSQGRQCSQSTLAVRYCRPTYDLKSILLFNMIDKTYWIRLWFLLL